MNNKLYFAATDPVHGYELWDPPPVEPPASRGGESVVLPTTRLGPTAGVGALDALGCSLSFTASGGADSGGGVPAEWEVSPQAPAEGLVSSLPTQASNAGLRSTQLPGHDRTDVPAALDQVWAALSADLGLLFTEPPDSLAGLGG